MSAQLSTVVNLCGQILAWGEEGGGVKMEKDVTIVNFMSHSRNPGNDRNYIRHEGRGGEGPAIDEVKGEK